MQYAGSASLKITHAEVSLMIRLPMHWATAGSLVCFYCKYCNIASIQMTQFISNFSYFSALTWQH